MSVMKTGIKLTLGIVFAAVAIVSATETGPGAGDEITTAINDKKSQAVRCYSESEVELLMKANHWTKQQATEILDIACSYATNPTE
jgi:hypothetical protein